MNGGIEGVEGSVYQKYAKKRGVYQNHTLAEDVLNILKENGKIQIMEPPALI